MKLTWNEDLTIQGAARLRDALLSALAESEDVLLDCGAVEAVDLAGLQVLVAASKSAERRGRRLAFAEGGKSTALDAAARASGLHSCSVLFGEASHG